MHCNYIANASLPSSSGKTISVIDPSDGQVFDEIQRSNAGDIYTAVIAARGCFDLVWQHITAAERGRLLMKLSNKSLRNLMSWRCWNSATAASQ